MSTFAPRITTLLIGSGLLVTPPGLGTASAQDEGVLLAGVVADEVTWTPVDSARVTILGTDLEVFSQANGTFQFVDVPLGPVTVRVDAPGFTSMVEEVEVSQGALVFVQFALPSVAAFLDEILVTGRRPGPASPVSESRSAVDLLVGRLPGVNGSPGRVGLDLSEVRLRGVGSFSGDGEPAIYLDGIRLAGSFGEAVSLLRMIPASDVRDIQLLRGPAAAFLHGSADGVILIRTKSGSSSDSGNE